MNSPSRHSEVAIFVCHDLIGLMATNELVPKIIELGCNPVIINTGMSRNRKPIVPPPPGPSFHMAGIVDDVLLPFLDRIEPEQLPRGKHLSYKHLAKIYNLRYIEVDDVNDPSFLDAVRNDENLIGGISVRFLQVFGRQAIDVFEDKGFLWNLHGGLLPQYQGLLIPYRAIDNKETHYGWTLHKMAEKIDAGDIIDVVAKPLNTLASVFNTYTRMVPHGVTMIAEALKNFIETSSYRYTPQSLEDAQYYPYPTSEEMERYERMGITFVGELEGHINTVVQTFLDPASPTGRRLKRELCNAAIAHQRIHEKRPEEDAGRGAAASRAVPVVTTGSLGLAA